MPIERMLGRADGIAEAWRDGLLLLGRVMIGWIFVQSGWRKLMVMPALVASIHAFLVS